MERARREPLSLSGGVVQSVTITNAGTGYTSPPTVSFTGDLERILHSVGGSFLITGFRGVGKTTVDRAGARRAARRGRGGERVAARSRSTSPGRGRSRSCSSRCPPRLRDAQDEERVRRMAPRVQRELLLAYARTSLSFNETRSTSTERGGRGRRHPRPCCSMRCRPSSSFAAHHRLARHAGVVPGVHERRRRARLPAHRRARRARRAMPIPSGWRACAQRLGRGEQPAPWRGRLVVVIDELDKLTGDEEGMQRIQTLLTGLKNLLTARGVHFLFVGGPRPPRRVAARQPARQQRLRERVRLAALRAVPVGGDGAAARRRDRRPRRLAAAGRVAAGLPPLQVPRRAAAAADGAQRVRPLGRGTGRSSRSAAPTGRASSSTPRWSASWARSSREAGTARARSRSRSTTIAGASAPIT